jgi:flagellar hook-associated protein 1 FlgK
MSGLFSSINTALQAMLANQSAIQVTEHNVANANTPGYKRQEAVLAPGIPYTVPTLHGLVSPGQFGTGVVVDRIRQFNLEFFDGRYRRELSETSRWDIEHDVLQQVEATLSESSDDGLIPKLDAFWNGWNALSNDPTNMALRSDLHERALALTNALNSRYKSLMTIQKDQDLSIIQRVNEINSAATQIARLNADIVSVTAAGNQPNDLIDERDKLLDRLAELGGAVANIQNNGEAIVSIGGHSLVFGTTTFTLSTEPDNNNDNLVKIYWNEDGRDLSISSGEIAGLLDARDQIIPQQLAGLDQVAGALVAQVNALHITGYALDGATSYIYFFDPNYTDALSIRLSQNIDDPVNIAAATNPDAPGDGNNAVAIANLQTAMVMNGNTGTINQFYTSQIGDFGLQVQDAQTRADERATVVQSLDTLRDSVSGVNLDEEAANLIKYQRAYQAATRMVTALDEMMDKVINGMGVVGR